MKTSFNSKEVEKKLPHLFSKQKVPSLPSLIKEYEEFIPEHYKHKTKELLKTDDLKAHEDKFLQWIRFSIAYMSQEFSPIQINKQWSNETHRILKKSWKKYFSVDDPIAIGSMGKLGSNELNLSSDIDLIFFAEDPNLQHPLRDFLKEISSPDSSPSGYKVDLDLRPEGHSAPLLIGHIRLGNHLWNNSDPWERYSYTRLQIRIGNEEVKKNILKVRDKFCYRKYLTSDFFPKFIELRPKYHKSVKNIDNHLKLSPGGIRDLELLIQTFQILHGGRDLELQNQSTYQCIRKLAKKGLFKNAAFFHNLYAAYLVLRNNEGLIHAFNPQGHFEFDTKNDKEESTTLKAMSVVKDSISEYSKHWDDQFTQKKIKNRPGQLLRELKAYALKNNYSAEIAEDNYSSFFKERTFSPYIDAILNQDKLKTVFFDLLCISPFGCQILARRPSLLDLFILRVEDNHTEDLDELLTHLSDLKMVQHILASLYFSKNKNLNELHSNLGHSYENIIDRIFDYFECKGKIDLLFLGKCAGNELGLNSDLDFIIINNTEENQSKLCRNFFRVLSTSTPFGPLVPFDNRGGPQGSASPLAVQKKSLVKFLEEEAEPWQRLMYLKNRLFSNDETLTFKSKKLSIEDQKSLDEVLEKRLKVTDPNSIYFKTAPGGLFHIEFTISNLYLKLEKAPPSADLKYWINDLYTLLKDSKGALNDLFMNFTELRLIEQKWCVAGYKKRSINDNSSERVQSILKENISLIDYLYIKHLG